MPDTLELMSLQLELCKRFATRLRREDVPPRIAHSVALFLLEQFPKPEPEAAGAAMNGAKG